MPEPSSTRHGDGTPDKASREDAELTAYLEFRTREQDIPVVVVTAEDRDIDHRPRAGTWGRTPFPLAAQSGQRFPVPGAARQQARSVIDRQIGVMKPESNKECSVDHSRV